MSPYRWLLYPFSLAYEGITSWRNSMFDSGVKKSSSFDVPCIAVGNLAMGGTGKTPMVEFLVEAYKDQYPLATLSRGYGRRTKGYILADKFTGPEDIGDEPYQIYSKYAGQITVAVGEKRALAIPQILNDAPETSLIFLDDAFQHRYVKADFYIMLTTFQRPFFEDYVVPAGTLREKREGAQRAQAVVVTKCPKSLSSQQQEHYKSEIIKYTKKDCPVYFSSLEYGAPYDIAGKDRYFSGNVILLTGIASNALVKEKVKANFNLLETLEYSDHHRYQMKDIEGLKRIYQNYKTQNPVVLTTEKDAVKLKDDNYAGFLKEIPIFALPVKVHLEGNGDQELLKQVSQAISNKGYHREV